MKFTHIIILALLLLAVYTTAKPTDEDLKNKLRKLRDKLRGELGDKPRDKPRGKPKPRAKIMDYIPATEILPLPVSVETVDDAPNNYLVKSSLYSSGYENYGMLRCLHNIYVSRIRYRNAYRNIFSR